MQGVKDKQCPHKLGLPVERGDSSVQSEVCQGRGRLLWGHTQGHPIHVKWGPGDLNGQGCDKGDGSRSLGGRWAKCGGADRDTSEKETTKDRIAERLTSLHSPFLES